MRRGVSKDYLKGSRRRYRGHYPINNLLTSRLGRDWDEVYSEFAAEFDSRSLAGRNFFRDLRYWVVINCWIGAKTGNVYDSRDRQLFDEFYVHPYTGQLCYAPRRVEETPVRPLIYIACGENRAYQKIEGIWYYTELVENPYYSPDWRRLTGKLAGIDALMNRVYGERYSVTRKRQLNKQELHRLRVSNDPH